MAIPQKFFTWVDGKVPSGLITAERLNTNFDRLYDMFDPSKVGISDDNIATNTKILISNRDYTGTNKIIGNYEFQTFPIVPNNSIPDSKLSANVVLKNVTNQFLVYQIIPGIDLGAGYISNAKIYPESSPPSNPQTGQIYYNSSENKFYGRSGTEWRRLDCNEEAKRIYPESSAPQNPSVGQVYFDTTTNTFYGWNGSVWKQLDYTGGAPAIVVRSYSLFGEADDNDSFRCVFKVTQSPPTVKLWFKGLPFPRRHYTELPYHTHNFTGISHDHATIDSGHYHSVIIGEHTHTGYYTRQDHTHAVTGYTEIGNMRHTHMWGMYVSTSPVLDHVHSYIEPDIGVSADTGEAGGHDHIVDYSGQSSETDIEHGHEIDITSQQASSAEPIDSTNLGTKDTDSKVSNISIQSATQGGTISYSGVQTSQSLSTQQKLYGNNLTVKVNTTDITNNIKTLLGWESIGDGTASHPLHTQGTSEMTISNWVSLSPGFHTLEIIEPITGYGLSLLVHLETS